MLCVCVLAPQSCPDLCDPVDCTPPGSSVHGISWARVLERVAIPSLEIFQRRDQTQVSHIAGGFFTVWAPREGLMRTLAIVDSCSSGSHSNCLKL